MRIFNIQNNGLTELANLGDLKAQSPLHRGFVWVACTRTEFQSEQAHMQSALQAACGLQLVDLHVSDLLNNQLPSHYDYTSQYDLLVFRRLAADNHRTAVHNPDAAPTIAPARGGPPILRKIDTNPIGFAIFDRLLLTVHPEGCAVRHSYESRLVQAVDVESRASGVRLPSSSADMMLRIVNLMVDGFLELRRELTHQLDHWQNQLLNPKTRFNNWSALLEARLSLHHLDEICEDQRAAIQDWIEAIKTWPVATDPVEQRERDLLQVRSRDVLEHIERVVHHVRRLEQSAETAIQMHFSVQGSRTNDIMRTLTVLTAIFLPLNLITGFFGMNFDALPLIHQQRGVFWAMGLMVVIAASLVALFWRKRYLARSSR
ncbi:MAG: magnesium transporter CorA family protein [Rhodoferax sp.]|nr:magnesium transporter CorA family protein [Rhodoferax sp.]MCF8210462.1 magnesium transporter CorA family protein [Rhodoferax sp.]